MSEKMNVIPQFVIAAASSGSGKTTISLGLMRLLRNKGYAVAPFKCGPDYIDTQFHKVASGNISVNLDLFMSSEEHIRNIYSGNIYNADFAIVEGVMGLFDGFEKQQGSTAHIAKLLNLPVVLIVNGSSAAYSVAALISGFRDFDKEVNLGGVIFNNVSSSTHFSLLKDACEDIGVKCFGYIKKNEKLKIPSRHLGLKLGDDDEIEEYIANSTRSVEEGIDIDLLIHVLKLPKQDIIHEKEESASTNLRDKRVIAVARDEAFSFIYEENLRAFKKNKRIEVEICFFSPLNDTTLPPCDFLYLPGGYPELYADRLSSNISMRESIKTYCEQGGYLYAECGGFMYLTKNIDNNEMCGIFPFEATMKDARLKLGYRRIVLGNNEFKGHEFHYSTIINPEASTTISRQFNGKGKEIDTGLYRYKNTIAGYTHLYWADNDFFNLWTDEDIY